MKKKASKKAKPQSRPAKPKRASPQCWRFRQRSRQDGRSYGNAALYATPQTIESLVRETGQNSLDAGVGGTVALRYRLIELPAGSFRRDTFLKSLKFDDQLRPHLDAVAKSKKHTNTAARVKAALAVLDGKETLWLLAVEDYGAIGLEGDEFDPEANFSALIRDVENSKKRDNAAGGSFGLGSKTLWSCSGLLTVLFASEIAAHPGKIRLIGKADLGFHEVRGGAPHGYVGHGHFGVECEEDGAESIWVGSQDQIISDLALTRESPIESLPRTGTTALIIGFDDPETETDSADTIKQSLRRHIATNYWPAMTKGQMRVFVKHEYGDDTASQDVEVDPNDVVPSLVDAFRRHLDGALSSELRQPGDVVSVPIPHDIPATRPEADIAARHSELRAEARLIIRLADEGAIDVALRDNVAMARGRAMVVKYVPRHAVALGARPFHAFLAAGTLVGDAVVQKHAEAFLRSAEPPAHDDWKLWPGLKARYQQGAGTKLQSLFEEVTRQLRAHIGTPPEMSDEIPEVLREIFRIRGVATAQQSTVRLGVPLLRIDGPVISVQATIEIPGSSGMRLTPVVTLQGEAGKGIELDWTTLEVDRGVVEGFTILSTAGHRKVRFSGTLRCGLRVGRLDNCAYKVAIRAERRSLEGV